MKQEYATRQKQLLIDFLRRNRDRQLSMADVADGVKNDNIGKSTVRLPIFVRRAYCAVFAVMTERVWFISTSVISAVATAIFI